MQEITWEVGGGGEPVQSGESSGKKLPYVSTWATFSKLPDEEKAKLFNAMRSELIMTGRIENK